MDKNKIAPMYIRKRKKDTHFDLLYGPQRNILYCILIYCAVLYFLEWNAMLQLCHFNSCFMRYV